MIPASYLFKDMYKQHWEEADAPVVVERRHHFIEGLLTPVAGAISALFHRRDRHHRGHFGGHAYD